MDHVHESLDPISYKEDEDKVEPEELLEECWFFGNLLDRKSRFLRSFSDPCTSSNYIYSPENYLEKSYEETYESIKKLPEMKGSNLVKAPSMPPRLENPTSKGNDHKRSLLKKKKAPSKSLHRAPSLPISLGSEEFQDEEIEFSMGKLIRQASMNKSDRSHDAKAISRRKPEIESIKLEGFEDIRTQPVENQLKTQKSLNYMEPEQLQGFKDLRIGFKKKNLNSHLRIEERNDLSEPRRMTKSCTPPIPKWGGKRSKENMKEQIKFWARAVASNVHQEC